MQTRYVKFKCILTGPEPITAYFVNEHPTISSPVAVFQTCVWFWRIKYDLVVVFDFEDFLVSFASSEWA